MPVVFPNTLKTKIRSQLAILSKEYYSSTRKLIQQMVENVNINWYTSLLITVISCKSDDIHPEFIKMILRKEQTEH